MDKLKKRLMTTVNTFLLSNVLCMSISRSESINIGTHVKESEEFEVLFIHLENLMIDIIPF